VTSLELLGFGQRRSALIAARFNYDPKMDRVLKTTLHSAEYSQTGSAGATRWLSRFDEIAEVTIR
jgi:hypothetical protein